MNEAETRAELIDPALREAGWGVAAESRTQREVIAPGRIMGKGKRAKPLSCDLVYRNTKLATIAAKAATRTPTRHPAAEPHSIVTYMLTFAPEAS